MRIRSPLTDHSLYAEIRQGDHPAAGGKIRRDRPPRGSQRTPANRRIFRLALMLVLVLLLMQQASDPDVYRRFFGAMGAPLDAVPSESHRPPGPERSHISEAEAIESLQVAPGAPQTGTPLAGTVERVDDETRRRLSASLAALRRGEEPHEVVEGETWDRLVQTVAEAAAKEGEINPETLAAALRSPGSPDAKALLQRLQAGLDASYWTTVSDATIWQPGDALAFYRLLEKGGQFEEPPTRVGYLSLSDQPLVYRGRPVAIEGDVARVEPQRAPANEFGVEDYWLVWLRPADGSDRPVMVYAAEIRGIKAADRQTPNQRRARGDSRGGVSKAAPVPFPTGERVGAGHRRIGHGGRRERRRRGGHGRRRRRITLAVGDVADNRGGRRRRIYAVGGVAYSADWHLATEDSPARIAQSTAIPRVTQKKRLTVFTGRMAFRSSLYSRPHRLAGFGGHNAFRPSLSLP